MMEEQPFGLPLYKNKNLLYFLNEYLETKYSKKYRDCQSLSLVLCWDLSDTDCLVASQKDSHTIVLFQQRFWIDLSVGIIINKNFSQYQKLKNFNQTRFNTYWGVNGSVTTSDFTFTLAKVKFYKKKRFI